jgi:hypothetical protein
MSGRSADRGRNPRSGRPEQAVRVLAGAPTTSSVLLFFVTSRWWTVEVNSSLVWALAGVMAQEAPRGGRGRGRG